MAEFGDMAYTRRLSSCSDTCMLKVCDASDIKDGRSPRERVREKRGCVSEGGVCERVRKVSIKEERVRV